MGVSVKVLNRKRESYRPDVWTRYKLLFEGGHKIFEARQQFLPQNPSEPSTWYRPRLDRFTYKNIAGSVIGDYVGAVFQAPLTMVLEKGDAAQRPELPEWYATFLKNPRGDGVGNFSDLLVKALTDALMYCEAWVSIVMPGTGEYANRAEQEAAGALETRLVDVHPSRVIDYGWDEHGLSYVMLHWRDHKVVPLEPEPEKDTLRWVFMDRQQIRKFSLEVKKGEDAPESAEPTDEGETKHRLSGANEGRGAVPMQMFRLRPSLWMMDRIASECVGECRARNGLAWYEDLTCFPQLWHSGDDPLVGEDSDKPEGSNTRRGAQYLWQLGKDEEIGYLEPGGASLTHLAQRLESREADIYKMLSEMASAHGAGAAASVLARSGASKMRDAVAKSIMAEVYAKDVRDNAIQLMDLVTASRGDTHEWSANGVDKFDVVDEEGASNTYATASASPVKSVRGRRELEKRFWRRMLPDAGADVLDEIDDEIDKAEYPDPMEMMSERSSLDDDEGDDGGSQDG